MTIARDDNNDGGDDDEMERESTEGSDDVERKVEVSAARGKLEIPSLAGSDTWEISCWTSAGGDDAGTEYVFLNFTTFSRNHHFLFFSLSPFRIRVPGSKEILQLQLLSTASA